MIRTRVRMITLLVVVSLLIASLPASGTTQEFDKQNNAPASGQLSFVSQVSLDLRKTLASLGSWLRAPAASTAYEDRTLNVGANDTVIKAAIEQLQTRSTGGSSTSIGPFDPDSSTARLDPMNETGGGGENPLSRNFNWNLPLVNLPGRAGMDLGLTLSYNSLVWTKIGTSISFDNDNGFPGPGFRLSFPVLQPLYYNLETGKYAFLLIASDGSRTELRQVGTSALYEAADSSHLLLDANAMTLRSTDGTELRYVLTGSQYNCTQIKDRNGNYITINYTPSGRIDTIIDTLARSIKFNYDVNGWLTSITQIWNQGSPSQVTHNWATFTYSDTTIQTNFTALTVYGPANNVGIKTLSKVTLADGSHSDFSYTSWGQVWKVSGYDADNHLLNYRSYNLPQTNGTAHTDCPRFTERYDWAAFWNGDTDATSSSSEEAVTTYAVPVSDSWTMPDGSPATGTVAQVGLKLNATTYVSYDKIYFIGVAGTLSGWQRGLPALVRTYDAANNMQRQVMTKWTQDNTASYIVNPRVEETNIYDTSGNRRRTAIIYQTASFSDGTTCRLPQDTYQYQSNASTVMRRSHTDYNLAVAYTTRHIIGLPSERTLYEVDPTTLAETVMSRVGFQYDDAGSIQGVVAPVQHDNTNYGSSFVAGRANVSTVKRYDVTNASQFTINSAKYDAAGSLVSTIDPLGHTVAISYSDSFSDNNNSRNTLAYAKTITDPDAYSVTSIYNFDFGAVTARQTPLPNLTTNTPGPQYTQQYDAIGRLERTTNNVNNAYTRYTYGPNYIESWSTVNTTADEAHGLQVFDGAGRVVATASNHPTSSGGFSAQRVSYDIAGRLSQQSNPTETSVSITPGATMNPLTWVPSGDDAAVNGGFGWIFKQQTYDWKGRPLTTTNTDGSNKVASYSNCGCAGGEITTITDEGSIVSGSTKKRQQKLFTDVVGRTWKIEVLNWDGPGANGTGGTIYSATVSSFNARDQVTRVRQFNATTINDPGDLSCPTATCQQSITTYDGYARVKTKHLPELQADSTNSLSSDHVTYDYFADDTFQKVTDARGATASFLNNGRRLVYSVHYTAPSGISIPADVTYTYDAAGNRKSMNDGSGHTDYNYDSLSRLTSEARQFSGLSGTYTLNYSYSLSGLLNSVTDPTGATVNYALNAAGQPTSVTGSSFGGVSTYASGLQYRASGALKHMNYSNGKVLDETYTRTLQPLHFQIPGVMSKNYEYHSDGSIKYSADLIDNRFDRSYGYDNLGRVTTAFSGPAARGLGDTTNRPYKQFYFYDAMGHLTGRAARLWSGFGGPFDAGDYVNNRMTGWQYDANGEVTASANEQLTYDAAGRSVTTVSNSGNRTVTRTMDGDGIETKRVDADFDSGTTITHSVYSSVLAKTITELNELGQKTRTFVYLNSEVLAWQRRAGNGDSVLWEYRDPSNATYRMAGTSGIPNTDKKSELDPAGSDAGVADTFGVPHSIPHEDLTYPGFADLISGDCFLNGISAPCGMTSMTLRSGAAQYWEPGTSITTGLPAAPKKPSQPPTVHPSTGGTPSAPVTTRTATTIRITGGVITIQRRTTDEEGVAEETLVYSFYDSLPGLIGPQDPAPHEPAPGQTLSQTDCDKKIAAIFGGPGAVAATVTEPSTLQHPSAGRDRYDHLAGNGVFHLYTNAQGTEGTVGLYTPSGFIGRPVTGTVYNGPNDPSPGEVNYNYERFTYRGGLQISFVHAGNPGVNRNDRNAMESVRVGNIAGPGGDGAGYNHTHVNVYLKGKRVDPRSIFCK